MAAFVDLAQTGCSLTLLRNVWSPRRRYGYLGFGGSDSHIVSRIGFCATDFTDDLEDIDDLVAALRGGRFAARSLRPTQEGAASV